MKLLTDVDVDEVSPVLRAANRRRFVLKGDEEEMTVDAEIADIMSVPWAHEGAMLDELRKNGSDETVEKAAVAAMRLLKGVEEELPDGLRETVEKLGTEMYGRSNPKLNSGPGPHVSGELTGSEDGAPMDGAASGPAKDGSARDGELSGRGSAPKVAADADGDWDDDDDEVSKAYDEMCKESVTEDQRRAWAKQGIAMPNGSYYIRNRSDLDNAIHAIGRGKGSHAAIRAHITARARALGATSMLPDSWKVSKEESEESLVRRVLEAVGLTKSQDARPATPEDDDDDADTEPDGDADDVKKGDDVETHATPVRKEDGTWDFDGVPDEQRLFLEPILKSHDQLTEELKDVRERLEKSEDARAERVFISKAKDEYGALAPEDELGRILKEAHSSLDEETFGKLEEVLKSANARVEAGDLFAELGSRAGRALEEAPAEGATAYAEAVRKADELVEKADNPLSRDQALARVFEQNPALYSRYMAEEGTKAMEANVTGRGVI